MPDVQNSSPSGDNAALAPDEGAVVPRLKLSETGFLALKTRNGRILEEATTAFRMPQLCRVVDEMRLSPPVAIGLNALRMLMNRPEVYIKPFDESTKSKARAKFLETCLHDMDESWQVTMQSFFPVLEYGHHVAEKVFRRRLKKNGSKYDDGLVGIAGLKTRPQATISKWNFDESGRNLISISQNISNVENAYRFQNLTDENGLIIIPREKFLLFNTDATNGNVEGNSVLKAAYLAYKQLTLLTEHMLTGVAKDSSGLPLIQIPPQYMASDASEENAAVYTMCKTIVDNLASGTQRGIVFPQMYDAESKLPLFSVELLESKGGKAYDVLAIIKALQATILSVLSCDAVIMSADKAGSFSLQDGDTNLLALQVSYRLGETANTLNTDLVRQLFELNGFDTAELPKICFKDVSGVSIEEFTKGVQRLASTSMLEVSRPVLNKTYEVMGFPTRPDDEPVDVDNLPAILTGQSSKSGSGMEVGTTGKGTAKNGVDNGQNPSDNNADNSA